MSILPSLFILGAAAAVALILTRIRPIASNQLLRLNAARSLVLAVGVQSFHFAEEAVTGFHQQFPRLLGLPAIPFSIFLLFNLGWLVIWMASVPGIRSGRPPAFFAAWFLAIAGLFNGVAHPLLAVTTGGYFPGLVTSPLSGVISVLLWLQLRTATQREAFA